LYAALSVIVIVM